MRRLFIAGSVFLAGLWTANPLCFAQETNTSQQAGAQTSAHPSSEAGPQKKQEGKAQKKGSSKADTTKAQPSPEQTVPPVDDQNPFPEQVSRDAAKAAESTSTPTTPSTVQSPSSADSNPFPEAVSRSAAKAVGNASSNSGEGQSPNQPPPLPPGVSSSQASALTRETEPDKNGGSQDRQSLQVINQARAKEDTHVGDYYLAAGNPQGAYLRYKDAVASDPANVDAIFGLAEAARRLNKIAEAERNYHIYLAVVPNGPKAKQAAKALQSLMEKK